MPRSPSLKRTSPLMPARSSRSSAATSTVERRRRAGLQPVLDPVGGVLVVIWISERDIAVSVVASAVL